MKYIDEPQVNLLDTSSGKLQKKTIIFISALAGLFLLAAFLIIRTAPQTNGITLQPKDSIFETVRNFIFKTDQVLSGQEEDRINILLLGMGGAGHDGPYLTDTNIIISIKPSTNEVAMISIPRDLGVTIGKYGQRKINHANAFGELAQSGQGGDYARQVFAETFNIDIPYYIRVDFKAFIELVDQVGGILVDVPQAFTDTAFPGPNFSYRTLQFETGPQTMSGDRALDFARSRHGNNGEGSDFARSRRQQLVLMGLKEKLLSAGTYTNPLTIQQMLASLSTHVTTNMNLGQMMYLSGLAKDVNAPLKNLVLDNAPNGFLVSTTGDSGAFLLFPKTGSYESINEAIDTIFTSSSSTIATTPKTVNLATSPTPSPASTSFPNLKIELQNGTWRAGLAARLKEDLTEKGFSILTIGNSLKKPIDKTAIYLLNSTSSIDAAKALSAELKAPILTIIPGWLEEAYNNPGTPEDESGMKYNHDADILVILGTDTP